MNAFTNWFRTRRTLASVVVIALMAGVPLTFAVLHQGFPVSDVDLTSRDVWVTNGEQLLGGRLNRQIDELNGSVVASSPTFDVLQDGDTLFMVDSDAGRIESVNAASTEVTSAVDVPAGSEVSFGGSVLSIMSPEGKLWAIPAVGDLQFDMVSDPPLVELGEDAHAVVTRDGTILAVSRADEKLYRVADLAAEPEEQDFPPIGEFQLAAVGEQPVVLDQSTNQIVTENGSKFDLGEEPGLRLQQTGLDSRFAIVATADSLARVDLGSGAVDVVPAGFESDSTEHDGVAAPVNQDGCAHGAWADAQRYLLTCEGEEPAPQDIAQPTEGSVLEFRVNRTVIALNDLGNGNVWLMEENMMLVDNWDDVVPPEETESEEIGEEKSSIQSFEDTLAERTETNRAPTAIDDEFGIRPGRTTILSLLDNDSDPDGDVLVISAYDPVDETTGHIDPIDGGRALQFTPAEGFVGTIAFNYTVDDGRGGTASANVSARVVPDGVNEPPYSVRFPGVGVEANQTVTYNVLTDWRDPDGDDLYLVGANPKSGDLVRFTPDGFITFTHQTSELGEKEVQFEVTDGDGPPVIGTLTVDVQQAGSLNPVGTPRLRDGVRGRVGGREAAGQRPLPVGRAAHTRGHRGAGWGGRRILQCRSRRRDLLIVRRRRVLHEVHPAGGSQQQRWHRADRCARPSARHGPTARCSEGHRVPAQRPAHHALGALERREPHRPDPRRAVDRRAGGCRGEGPGRRTPRVHARARHRIPGAHRAGQLHLHDLRRGVDGIGRRHGGAGAGDHQAPASGRGERRRDRARRRHHHARRARERLPSRRHDDVPRRGAHHAAHRRHRVRLAGHAALPGAGDAG